MKLFGKLTVALAFAFVALGASNSSAVVICGDCNWSPAGAVYLGNHSPVTGDQSNFDHELIPQGAINDLWVFQISAPAGGDINAIFNPLGNVTGFTIALLSAAGTVCGGAPGSVCVPVLGGPVGNVSAPSQGTVNATFTNLAAGYYAFRITGTGGAVSPGNSQLYSGNLTVRNIPVPEPLTLSLLGLGLAGLAARRRRA